MALPRGAVGLSAVCDCGIDCSYSFTTYQLSVLLSPMVSVLSMICTLITDCCSVINGLYSYH